MLARLNRIARNPRFYIREAERRLARAFRMGNPLQAAVTSNIFLNVSPDDEAQVKALVFAAMRDPAAYKQQLDRDVYAKQSHKWLYQVLLSAVEYGCGNPELALHHFEIANAIHPTPLLWHFIGRCYCAMDDDQRTVRALDTALEKFPGENLLICEKATAQFRLGDKDSANKTIAPAIRYYDEDRQKTMSLQAELDKAMAENIMERQSDGDIYDDNFVTNLWWDYNFSFRRYNYFQEGSAHISHLIRHHVGKLLAGPASEAPAVVDFGVMCGTPNYQLARRFPDKQHYGVDRQPLIKTLNDAVYATPNLHFHDGCMLDFIREKKASLKGGLLFHARTSVCCYPAYMQKLYAACFEAGIQHIALIEFSGLSKSTLQFHDYNDPQHLSVALRSIMFIHNHVKMLQEAGYRIVEEKRYSRLGLTVDMGLGESQSYLYATRDPHR